MQQYRHFLSILIIVVSSAFADRGLIPANPDIRIFEPTQRAMLAWNGSEEILLLSTDIYASDSTPVLEVIPLPAEPEVKKGDLKTFQKATDLINKKLQAASLKRNGGKDGEGVKTPDGEVTFHKKIGAHDISVTHLLHAAGFVDWVNDYLQSIGLPDAVVPEAMKEMIEEYISDDYKWYVFDVVTVGRETVTNEPIQYRFKTDWLYYPLKITSTASGHTTVDLLVLTPHLLRRFPELPIKRVQLQHDPVTINNSELREIDEDMYELLESWSDMKIRVWRIEGDLESFDGDLIAQ